MDAFKTVYASQTAQHLYESARNRAWLNRVWSALTGRPRRLLGISDVQGERRGKGRVRSSHYAGVRAVPIRRIRGSEGRCEDFDAGFLPLRGHSRERWVGIAEAHLLDVTLPPVELVQIGETYFVRDGHHRISVAQALGQRAIDAEVTILEIAEPPTAERQAPTGRLAAQPA